MFCSIRHSTMEAARGCRDTQGRAVVECVDSVQARVTTTMVVRVDSVHARLPTSWNRLTCKMSVCVCVCVYVRVPCLQAWQPLGQPVDDMCLDGAVGMRSSFCPPPAPVQGCLVAGWPLAAPLTSAGDSCSMTSAKAEADMASAATSGGNVLVATVLPTPAGPAAAAPGAARSTNGLKTAGARIVGRRQFFFRTKSGVGARGW